MATNKNAMIRYRALDRCLRNRYKRYYIEDLVNACCEALAEFSDKAEPVHKRQVQKDLDFIDEQFSTIERVPDGRRKFYRYEDVNFSMSRIPLSDEEIDKLKETIFMLGRFKGMPQFEWMEEMIPQLEDRFGLKGQSNSVMGFEQNLEYSGTCYLSDLFNAIINKQALRVVYRKFDCSERVWRVHPYYLKQYNNRWFLFGYNEEYYSISNVPLDRIKEISPVGIPYRENTDIDFEEYFEDVVGVTINPTDVATLKLHFSKNRFPYIESKPIHPTMRFVDKENGIVSISVIPNRELDALLFSFGEDLEILEPQWFRKKFAEKVKLLHKKYSTCEQ